MISRTSIQLPDFTSRPYLFPSQVAESLLLKRDKFEDTCAFVMVCFVGLKSEMVFSGGVDSNEVSLSRVCEG